jgi:hypothetical protein
MKDRGKINLRVQPAKVSFPSKVTVPTKFGGQVQTRVFGEGSEHVIFRYAASFPQPKTLHSSISWNHQH